MRFKLLFIATALALVPGLVLYLQPNATSQDVGIFFMFLGALLIPGSFATPHIGRLVWFIFSLDLIIISISFGYITLALSLSPILGLGSSAADLLALSILALEFSIITSNLFGAQKKYGAELKKAGYDEEEFQPELDRFTRTVVLLAGGVALASIGFYLLFSVLPQFQLDSLSVLVVSALIYFGIARYVLRRKQPVTNPSGETTVTPSPRL